MSKIFAKVFPLLDYLYIFQLLEYYTRDFLAWFFDHPFKRNLQRKHKLIYTPKILILLALTLTLIVLVSCAIGNAFANYWLDLLIFLIAVQVSPFFIVVSQFLLIPLESHQKQKIMRAAQAKINRLPNLTVVAITGSFAKTSTKDMLYTLLWKNFRVVKTPKSFNTPLSVARTILSDVKDNTDIFLVEMDAYHPGEIAELAKIVKPKLGIITGIAPQHLERFGSIEKIAETQFELADYLSEDGMLVINADNAWSRKIASQKNLVNSVFYGKESNNDFYATDIRQTADGTSFTLHMQSNQLSMNVPLFGDHHAVNFAGAAAIVLKLSLDNKTLQKRAQLLLPTPHRLEIKKVGNLTIIDNSYNTNPSASQSSLKVLADFPGSQKIVITPGMIELGAQAQEENRKFGQNIAKVADTVITVGQQSQVALLAGLKDSAYSEDKVHTVNTTKEAMNMLAKIAQDNAVVLIENDLPDQYF